MLSKENWIAWFCSTTGVSKESLEKSGLHVVKCDCKNVNCRGWTWTPVRPMKGNPLNGVRQQRKLFGGTKR